MNVLSEHKIELDEYTMRPAVYEIRVKGRLDSDRWSQWFGGMKLTVDANGDTVLVGQITDQAALYGLLSRLRDLALPLLSVNRLLPTR